MALKNVATRVVRRFSARSRARRGVAFRELLQPTEDDRILDLGSEEGDHFASVVPFRANVTIADIDAEALARGRERYGFEVAVLDETGRLPFPDDHFDIVFCSSVIEHVTVPKHQLGDVRSKREFEAASRRRQHEFAAEIRRVGKRYFVQTPNKWFPIESHTWLPVIVVMLPRAAQLRFVEWTNRWWIKQTAVDWNLLTAATMAETFPGAEIVRERALGLTKSLIAVKRA